MTTTTPKTTCQQLATTASRSQLLPIGLDCGNGQVKMVGATGETLMPSYVSYQSKRPDGTRSYVEYLGGSRGDLEGRAWVSGEDAYYFSPSSFYRPVDSVGGKAELCLQLFLSAIAMKSWRASWEFHIVASVHDGEILGSQIRKALEGEHQIWANGKRSNIRIQVGSVLEEGAGALVHYSRQIDTRNALVYDLGNGTIIASSFSGLATTGRNYSTNGGVEGLFDAIAASEGVRRKLGHEGDRHIIRRGVEAGDFRYGRSDWSFVDSYKHELPSWADRVLGPMVRLTKSRRATASALIAVGGGAMLPGIAGMLTQRDIKVLDEPVWANARGLYQFATRQFAQGA